jgi:hypothetical protein
MRLRVLAYTEIGRLHRPRLARIARPGSANRLEWAIFNTIPPTERPVFAVFTRIARTVLRSVPATYVDRYRSYK